MSPDPASSQSPQDWRRFGRSTVVPLLLLVALLVLLGHMHIDLAAGFTAPRVVCDDQGGFVFYDGGSTREPVFFMRRLIEDEAGAIFGKQEHVRGVLAGAALLPDSLVTLYSGKKDGDWFYSLSKRATLERVWSGHFRDPDLHLPFPRHVAALSSNVFVFGSDEDGNLRAARIDPAEKMVKPLEPPLRDGAFYEGVKRDADERVRPPLAFSSAVHEGELYVMWRVPAEVRTSGLPRGEVRWARFDGAGFGRFYKLQTDLAAFSLVEGLDGTLRLYGVPYAARDSKVLCFERRGDEFRDAKPLAYEREGLTGGAGVNALAAGRSSKRVLLFAQVGTIIRYVMDTGHGFGEWKDLARRPAEQVAVVYGWFAALLAISLLLIAQGMRALGRRGARLLTTPPQQPDPGQLDELASIPERVLAFLIDLTLVVVLSSFLTPLLPSFADGQVPTEPMAQLTLLAWFAALLLLYFIVCEGLFARTLGKRLVGIEVQDITGASPGWAAALYRNAFRIELLLPPLYVVPVLSLLVMLTSNHRQRPGDLVAFTTVRRTHTKGRQVVAALQEPAQE
ncbi:MAG: RDD family protein [Planctomycetota bacterium]